LNQKPDKREDEWYISKILRKVQNSKSFYFNYGNGIYTGRTARSLEDFYSILKTVAIRSINFHFKRGDFQRWIQNDIGDIKLSNEIRRIPKKMRGENLRKEIIRIMSERLIDLKSK
jgi:hypothetical protein